MFIYYSMQFAMDTQLRMSKARPNGTHLIPDWGKNINANMSLSADCSHAALFPVVVFHRFIDSMQVRPWSAPSVSIPSSLQNHKG